MSLRPQFIELHIPTNSWILLHKPSFPLQFNPSLVYSQVTQEALKGRSGPLCDKSLMAEVGMEIETPQYITTLTLAMFRRTPAPAAPTPTLAPGSALTNSHSSKTNWKVRYKINTNVMNMLLKLRNIWPHSLNYLMWGGNLVDIAMTSWVLCAKTDVMEDMSLDISWHFDAGCG